MTETRISLEKAAEMLGTSLDNLLVEIYELGITVHHDEESHIDYITKADLEDLKESMGLTAD